MSANSSRRARLHATVAILALITGSQTLAAEETSPPPQDGGMIDTIMVNATRGSKLEDMDISATVISREAVTQAPQNNIDQVLNKVPGVVISTVPSNQTHPTGKSVQMRGLGGAGAQRTLVMVDGIPINDPFYRYVNWDKVPKETIESVEIIRGGGGATLWGNMAMGGVINIVTRDPEPDEKRLSFGYGSDNTYRVNTAITPYSDGLFKVGLTAGRMSSDGYNLTPKNYRNAHSTATESYSDDAEISLILTPSKKDRYYLKMAAHDMHEFNQVWDVAKNAQQSFEFKAGGKTSFDDGSVLDINAWYGRYLMKTQNASSTPTYNYTNPGANVRTYNSSTDKNPYYDLGGSTVWKKDLSDTVTDVMVGVDGRNMWGTDNTVNYSSAGAITGNTPLRAQQQFSGIFSQATWRPEIAPVIMTLGLRQDFWRAFDYQFAGRPAHSYGLYNHFDPRLGVKVNVTREFSVKGAVYENFSAPGMNQMFRSYGSSSSYSAANPELAPETNFGREIGVEWAGRDVTVSATGFYNQISNFMDKAQVCSSSASCAAFSPAGVTGLTKITKYYNSGNATFKGWEVLGEWRAAPTLTFNSGLTRNISAVTSNARLAQKLGGTTANSYVPTGVQIGGVIPLMFQAGATWEAITDLKVTTTFKSWTRYPDDTLHTTFNSPGSTVDLGGTYKVNEHLDLFANAQNLFNVKYYATGLSASNTGTPPTQGQPLAFFGGVRVTY